MPQRRGTPPPSPSSAGPAPLPPGAPVDVRIVRARVEGRAVLAPAPDPAAPPAPATGLLAVPLWVLAGTAVTAWLGSRGASGWAALAATVVCLAVARGWVLAERRTARVDERVRVRFAPAGPASGASGGTGSADGSGGTGTSTGPAQQTARVVLLPDTDAARAAASAASSSTTTSVTSSVTSSGSADRDAPDDAPTTVSTSGAPDAPDPSDSPADPLLSDDDAPAGPGLAERAARAAGALTDVSGRLGRGPALLAAVVAVALVLVTVSAVGALLARSGALELVALAGPLGLLAVHAKLLVDRAAVPVLGEGFLARWADAALLGRDLRVRLASGVAAPVLYLVAWQSWHTWWTTLGVVAAGLLVAVQVAVVAGLARDRDRLPGLATVRPADGVIDLTTAEAAGTGATTGATTGPTTAAATGSTGASTGSVPGDVR